MSKIDLENAFTKMSSLIEIYQRTKEVRDICDRGDVKMTTKAKNLIIDVLDEKIRLYEVKIIELSMKLAYIKSN